MAKPRGFDDEGIWWMGSRKELDDWKAYKQGKAIAFVNRGYSVSWYPDGDHWMEIYTPYRFHAKQPELRAMAKFYAAPSNFGIDNGRVSKLLIQSRSEDLAQQIAGLPSGTETWFNYDRGPDVDRLNEHPAARRLYDAVLEELG